MFLEEAIQYGIKKLNTLYSEGESKAIINLVSEKITAFEKIELKNRLTIELTKEQEYRFQEMLTELLSSKPVQYVLQEAWFAGLKFHVDQNVLIPRPETEELVEWILSEAATNLKILDIGTGSGCIPIILKMRMKQTEIWACDVSDSALKIAEKNAAIHATVINFFHLDFLNKSAWEILPVFDLIVSNPPYVTEKEKDHMDANVLKFEPALALFVPENNPLVFYEAIAEFGKKHLSENGVIYTEINESLGSETVSIFESRGYTTTLKKDMQQKNRLLRAGLPK